MVTLLWFRRDLRLSDNPALAAAVANGGAVVPVYVLDDDEAGAWTPGGASRWWLHGSLVSLAKSLDAVGSRLILRSGAAETAIGQLVEESGAKAVFWNRRYEPWATARDERLAASLRKAGVDVRSFNASLLREPWELATQKDEPYRVFTPFWKALRARRDTGPPVPVPKRIPAPANFPDSDDLSSWKLLPTAPDWAGGLRSAWQPGEAGALRRLESFAENAVFDYRDKRNFPGIAGTSRLSPHLHFGEVGPRQIWDHCTRRGLVETGNPMAPGVETFLSEIAWREFAHHLLFHFPALPEQPLRAEFARFSWADDADGLAAWQQGRTGYPIVDAGMRELWSTGWMHNRVRMIVASFLIKDLMLHWRHGEAWFWDTLVDADLANNAAGWQWVAGSGADAAPYFRVFNPSLQGAKFDPQGDYVRRWIPELAGLPKVAIHAPWEAKPIELSDAGVRLGQDYPLPIVDHGAARRRALDAFQQIKARG